MTSLKALHRDVLATAQRLFFDLLQAVGPCQPAASGSITLLVDGPQEGSNPNRRPSITTRHINSENKHWLRREARRVGASTEELVGRPVLSPTDQSEAKRIKLHKLALKDRMESIIRSHALQAAS